MGKLVAQNKWLFIGAALCVLISVVIDYLTPLLLAETLDYYLSGQPSTMPAFVNPASPSRPCQFAPFFPNNFSLHFFHFMLDKFFSLCYNITNLLCW